ncbi:hypothetical protein KKHLCK_11725 [Candidatus Electrothrix laxa]
MESLKQLLCFLSRSKWGGMRGVKRVPLVYLLLSRVLKTDACLNFALYLTIPDSLALFQCAERIKDEIGRREFHTWRPVCNDEFKRQSCQSTIKLPPLIALVIPHSLIPEQSSSVRERILIRPCLLSPRLIVSISLTLISTALLMSGQ